MSPYDGNFNTCNNPFDIKFSQFNLLIQFFFRNRVKLDNNNLHFLTITFDEDGLYQCVAENVHGMIVSSTWVHVVGEFICEGKVALS